MKPKIINLTPHEVSIIGTSGEVELVIPPPGRVARVETTYIPRGPLDIEGATPGDDMGWAEISIYRAEVGKVIGLPDLNPAEDTYYIVSKAVFDAVPGRRDVLAPGELVRDEQGRPVACKGLVAHWYW